MRKTSTQQPIVPPGWTGRDYNNWHKYLKSQLDRINGIDILNKKLKIN